MRLLYITGEDYSAVHYESNFGTDKQTKELIKLIEQSEEGIYIYDDESYEYFEASILEFEGEISKEFLDWIKNDICDYDGLKHTCFYIIE